MRVIVDENAGPGTLVWDQFQRAHVGKYCEYVFLAKSHRGIPDVEILDKLLGPHSVLVTGDRVLHMRAIEQGYRSYTLNERGHLTRKLLPGIELRKPLPTSVHSELQADYRHLPNHDLGRRLSRELTERHRKRYRTVRRRIRSHFGSAAAIQQIAVTIGAKSSSQGLLCGFAFHVSGNSGVKGLRASEGYCLVSASHCDAASPLLHALRDQYLLHLDQLPTDLYIIPPSSLALTEQLLRRDSPNTCDLHEGLRRLLCGVPKLAAHACVKGPYHRSMQVKLDQLARSPGNEVTPLDFTSTAAILLSETLPADTTGELEEE